MGSRVVTYRGWVSATSVRRGIAALVALVALLPLIQISAQAAPAPTRDIRQVQRQVEDLQMQAEAATEKANAAQISLEGIQAQLASIQARQRTQQKAFAKDTATISALARAAYMRGSFDPSLQVLLADDPTQFLAQASVMSQLQGSEVAALRRLQTSQLRLSQTQKEIADRQKAAAAASADKASALKEVNSQLAAAQNVLASLQTAERQRLAALQAAQAAKQRLQAQRATAAAARPGSFPGVSSRAQSAIKYALSMVGHRYVAATAGPSTFDCSGLTMAAWKRAGINLAHLSYAQWRQTKRVPVSQIRPGDLVFYFGGSAHHVAMYIGNGKMVSASNPSAGVQIINFLGPWYGARFSGVGRVVG